LLSYCHLSYNGELMPIVACGINHKTAPIALRERVVFAPEKIPLYLSDLINNENIPEAVLISTCNRTELYCHTDNIEQAMDWFLKQHAVAEEVLRPVLYCHTNEEAVQHMISVACGLDSLVLGEPQILGQMKEAFSESCAAGSVRTTFHRLFQQIFSVAKEVRTHTSLGACPVSIASTAVNLIKQVSERALNESSILLLGAGDTIELVLRHLKNHNPKEIIIINRDREKSKLLATQYEGESYAFSDLSKILKKVDVVISATASPTPIITKEMLSEIHQSLILVDLAVPRDIDDAVRDLSHIKLFSVDDLKTIVQKHLHGREHAADKAREVITEKTKDFMSWVHAIDKVASTIRAYRKQMEGLCEEELTKSLRQLHQGEDAVEVLTGFARALTNKLLHLPTVHLREEVS